MKRPLPSLIPPPSPAPVRGAVDLFAPPAGKPAQEVRPRGSQPARSRRGEPAAPRPSRAPAPARPRPTRPAPPSPPLPRGAAHGRALPRACVQCGTGTPWASSPACFGCLRRAGLVVDAAGQPIDPAAPPKHMYAARYRCRPARCNRAGCPTCPHGLYVYRAWRAGGVQRELYLGAAEAASGPYERPVLRAERAGRGARA